MSTPAPNPDTAEAVVSVRSLGKWYGAFQVLTDVTLSVARGERIIICGPSGSGKSTLIRCLNQLEQHQAGQIVVDGIELGRSEAAARKVRTEVGMVFQHFNLFPHLDLVQN